MVVLEYPESWKQTIFSLPASLRQSVLNSRKQQITAPVQAGSVDSSLYNHPKHCLLKRYPSMCHLSLARRAPFVLRQCQRQRWRRRRTRTRRSWWYWTRPTSRAWSWRQFFGQLRPWCQGQQWAQSRPQDGALMWGGDNPRTLVSVQGSDCLLCISFTFVHGFLTLIIPLLLVCLVFRSIVVQPPSVLGWLSAISHSANPENQWCCMLVR